MKNWFKLNWPLLALVYVFTISSWYFQGGGLLLYGEADWFLIDHNDPSRSFWNVVLCPHKHDADQYLARETTHVVEHIDARFINICTSVGLPHFQSICTYLFLSAIGYMVWRSSLRVGLGEICALLIVAVFLTSPSIFWAGNYIRPGHVHSAFWATALVLFLYFRPLLSTRLEWLSVFLLALMATWADRQGLFLCLVAAITLVIIRGYGWKNLCSAIVVAVVVHTMYYSFVGPWLIARYTPFQVGKEYQTGIVTSLVPILVGNFYGGLSVAISNLSVLFGNISPGLAVSVVVLSCYKFVEKWFLPLLWFLMSSSMYAMILVHQQALVWPDIMTTGYYNIFATAMFLLVAVHVIHLFNNRRLVEVVLACLVIGNISLLPSHLSRFKNGHLTGFISGAPFIRQELARVAYMPDGKSTNRWDAHQSMFYTEFSHVMKNPLEYGGRLSVEEFVESSNYLQWFRSQKGLPFGKGGR